MKTEIIVWLSIVVVCLTGYIYVTESVKEPFSSTINAIDAPPTSTEVKKYYKDLLIYVDSSIKSQTNHATILLTLIRSKIYKKGDLRRSLINILDKYPKWIPEYITAVPEIVPQNSDVVAAVLGILAYIQRYYPNEPDFLTGTTSTVQNIINDFATRFVYEPNQKMEYKPDFNPHTLTQKWSNPLIGLSELPER